MSSGVNPFQKSAMEIVASWLELEAVIKLLEAATIRGNEKEYNQLRDRAHELLDIHMDAKQSVQVLAHEVVGQRRPNGEK
jgi:hypothetical protein